MKFRICTTVCCLAGSSLLAGSTPSVRAGGEEPAKAERVGTGFTLDEAVHQLKLYPKDPYLQFVTLQLARRQNRLDEIAGNVDAILGNGQWANRAGRRGDVDLFSIFTGALAVQEGLQLDTMRGVRRRTGGERVIYFSRGGETEEQQKTMRAQQEAAIIAREKRRAEIVEVASLTGPTINSHPWDEMLAGKKPDVGPLARKVPDDFFFAEFGSLVKLLDVLDSGDLWSKHLLHQTAGEARSQQVGERLKRQLAVETNPLVRPFYDLVVEEVAVTGSDLFFNEGSDLTLLFQFKQPAVFKARLDGFLQSAEKADKTIQRSTGKFHGVDFVHLTNPDRSVHVFSAYPEANLHVRSNSLVALQRVLAAIQGKDADGRPVRRLGDSSELAYVRTLLPRRAQDEDGFLYLSDPFIRKLVGPGLKLTERRRVLCYNHLRMIGHASLMYRSESGKSPDSLEALVKSQCAPGLFGTGDLACPDGGRYSLSADGTSGVCSHHGHSHDLVPCCEHPVAKVTGEEADEYQAFLAGYNAYWRTFFDPIAVRIKVSPEQYRLETIILPLIDNSIYTGLATALGGKPEPLDALPVPHRNIFSVNFRFDKEGLAEKAGWKKPEPDSRAEKEAGNFVARGKSVTNLQQIALGLHSLHQVEEHFPAHAKYDNAGKPLLSWRVMLLPYVGEPALYNEFHLDEPWDSQHNKTLIDRMPAVYQTLNDKVKQRGKTTYLAPVGKGMLFTGDKEPISIRDVTDGTSNTIMIVQADEQHAVTWTRPQDLTVDLKKPEAGLADYPAKGCPVVLVDGSVVSIRQGIPDTTLAAMFTRNDGLAVSIDANVIHEQRQNQSPFLFGFGNEMIATLGVPQLVLKGIGNQVGMHVYDSSPLFDFNLPSFLGEAFGSFNGRGMLGGEMLPISFLIASLNAPVYVAIPVQDEKIVDEFLERLDRLLAGLAREPVQSGWFQVQSDFYRFQTSAVPAIRCQSIAFGPLKFRTFWARIGNGLYIASKPFILDDLAAATASKSEGPAGHGMFRIRSRNWDQVLPEYRLGWAENNRRACLDNLGPLSSVARSLPDFGSSTEVCRCADRLHGAHLFCPEGGVYECTADGKMVTCSIHGSGLAPQQAAAPAKDQALGKLIGSFAGLEATLTFLDDGLHAVLKIDRK